MQLENVVVDALEPARVGAFWRAALDLELLSDDPGGYEARLSVPDGPWLDLCVQPVREPATAPPRLHLDLSGQGDPQAVVQRLLSLGASHLDIGQQDVPWTVLADPEGNPFCVLEDRARHQGTGPVAEVPIDSADPSRDQAFWAALTGWVPTSEGSERLLRHPSGRGPWLSFCPEPEARTSAKNRMHLDVRLEPGDDLDDVLADLERQGARRFDPGWGDLPWTLLRDPSGNELCLLPSTS
ncbi:VOC family protein [Auraticoccus monumenti]|uniref:VOC domain-containing protein n=1 Tax=Auraticoccus monumenti TaxID=675864 RepID=A0A1G7AJF9_9ACTN|nr:VOC family protein [Auraticoccus monumenti]SDE14850.1 hypothetical protein SAMN04489747_2637 [Auraticoccus monumenti]